MDWSIEILEKYPITTIRVREGYSGSYLLAATMTMRHNSEGIIAIRRLVCLANEETGNEKMGEKWVEEMGEAQFHEMLVDEDGGVHIIELLSGLYFIGATECSLQKVAGICRLVHSANMAVARRLGKKNREAALTTP